MIPRPKAVRIVEEQFTPGVAPSGEIDPEVAILIDQVANVNKGASFANQWRDKDINVIQVPTSWISLNSNQFSINGAAAPGKYLFEWNAVMYDADEYTTRLFNTNSASELAKSVTVGANSATNRQIPTQGFWQADITSFQSYKIQYFATRSDPNGLGVGVLDAAVVDNTMLNLKITKLQSL